MYVSVGINGVTWFDWIWLALGLIADLGSYSGGGTVIANTFRAQAVLHN